MLNKKIMAVALATGMLLSITACGGDGNQTGTEAPTEVPTAEITETATENSTEAEPAAKVNCTFTVKDQDGTPMAEVTVLITPSLANDETEALTATTDAEGKFTVVLQEGLHTVQFEGLPEGYLQGTTSFQVEKNTAEYQLDAINNIPNGTEERPFIIIDEKTAVSVPAGTAYTYVTYGGMDCTFTLKNTTLTVIYQDNEYAPDAEGTVTFPLLTEGSRDPSYITLKNAGDSDVEGEFVIKPNPGTLNNPYPVEALGQAVTAVVPKETTVYYLWKASENGVIMVYSETPKNHIAMTNLSNSVTSYFTDGTVCEYIAVSEGDELLLAVACNDTSVESTEVVFTLSSYQGTAESPVSVKKDTVIFSQRAGETRHYSYDGAAGTLVIKGEGITVKVGDTEYTPDDSQTISVSLEGASEAVVFTVVNHSDKNQEINLTFSSTES